MSLSLDDLVGKRITLAKEEFQKQVRELKDLTDELMKSLKEGNAEMDKIKVQIATDQKINSDRIDRLNEKIAVEVSEIKDRITIGHSKNRDERVKLNVEVNDKLERLETQMMEDEKKIRKLEEELPFVRAVDDKLYQDQQKIRKLEEFIQAEHLVTKDLSTNHIEINNEIDKLKDQATQQNEKFEKLEVSTQKSSCTILTELKQLHAQLTVEGKTTNEKIDKLQDQETLNCQKIEGFVEQVTADQKTSSTKLEELIQFNAQVAKDLKTDIDMQKTRIEDLDKDNRTRVRVLTNQKRTFPDESEGKKPGPAPAPIPVTYSSESRLPFAKQHTGSSFDAISPGDSIRSLSPTKSVRALSPGHSIITSRSNTFKGIETQPTVLSSNVKSPVFYTRTGAGSMSVPAPMSRYRVREV